MNKQVNLELRFWKAFTRAADIMREYSSPMKPEDMGDITLRQIRIMKIVWLLLEDNPCGITLKCLAKTLKLTPGTTSELVDTLVRKDALKREQNPNDRREILISLTERSREMINTSIDRMNSLSTKLLSEFKENERVSMTEGLEKILETLNMIGKDPEK